MPERSDAQLTVSDLAERSGLPVSTVRYYVREGLIPPGQRRSRTRVVYDGDHLRAIETIKFLREAQVPVTEIRSLVTHDTEVPSDTEVAAARRDDLLEAATSCFLSTGFAGTSLAAIARAASMSKATLYRVFSSKEEIFMACAERVFHRLYADAWPVIRQARTPEERLRARWEAFSESFASWAPMMDLVRGLAVGNPAFGKEYLRLLDVIVTPIGRELSMLRADIDAEFMAYVVMGMSEAAARAASDGLYDSESAWGYLRPMLAGLARDPSASASDL